MCAAASLQSISRPLDDEAGLGRVLDELLAARTEPPAVLALGEPTHGIKAFPLLRNELLAALVGRGFRWIALESDIFAASMVDEHVRGARTDLDEVLAGGFSHGFGGVPGNRELVEWLRTHNADLEPAEQVRFYGFDPPLEFSAAPSPRHSLVEALDYLPAPMRPSSVGDLDSLLGPDADWSTEAAMYDPAASIGRSDGARALRVVADDVASAVRRAAPVLRPIDPSASVRAAAHARTAQGLLRYHAAMADDGPDRIAALLSLRAEMMADNLLAICAQEQRRGPGLVFAHNVHLQRVIPTLPVGDEKARWASAGALVAGDLGERYVFIATDANPDSDPTTLQGMLSAATTRRALFQGPELRDALPSGVVAGQPILPGHLPLLPSEAAAADAVIFVADTDGKRHQYW